jgi:hypothetical protein
MDRRMFWRNFLRHFLNFIRRVITSIVSCVLVLEIASPGRVRSRNNMDI